MYSIAIDGPSAAGKSTIAKFLAKKLNIIYLDTGAMYRAIGLKCLNNGIDISISSDVTNILNDTVVEIRHSNLNQLVFLDGEDVTDAIRRHEVSSAASRASAIPEVRLKLVELQRSIASKQSAVLDGRDIGTYVLPNAKYKFFLTSTPETRARRRYLELLEKNQKTDYETVLLDINKRDYDDSHREFAPLRQAKDAIMIDTTALSVEETAKIMLSYIEV